jgi:hypothetical protein
MGEEIKTCDNMVEFEINILDIKPEISENHNNKIELSENLGIVMKYPNFKLIDKLKNLSETEVMMETILNCIDYIYNDDEIFYAKDVSKKELVEFVEGMNHKQFLNLQQFFETIPKITKDVDFECDKCGYKEKIVLEGIQNFFD